MAFGGFYKGEKKKPKKGQFEKVPASSNPYSPPQVEILPKGKSKFK